MRNRPWEYTDVWKNQSEFMNWLRGQLRQIWSDYPVRIEHKDSMCVRVTPALRVKYNLHPSTKWAGQCVFCKGWFPKSKMQSDHIKGNAKMTQMDDIDSYLDHLLCPPSNLQLVCVPCHKIKSYAESSGMSMEDAALEKAVIKWTKDYDTTEQKNILILAGFKDSEISNAKSRRDSARKLLTNL